MNIPSLYPLDLFKELNWMEEVNIKIILARQVTSDRRKLGWREETDEQIDFYFLDQSNPIWDAVRVAWAKRDRVHTVNGI